MTINPGGVTNPNAGRTPFSRGQKIGILAILCSLILAAVILYNHFGKAGHEDKQPQQAVGPGLPFRSPNDIIPRPIIKPIPAALRPPAPLPARLPANVSATDAALNSKQMAYSSGGDDKPTEATKINASADESNGDKDELSSSLTHSDLGGMARAHRMKHPSLTIPAGAIIPCILRTAINSQLKGFVDCQLPAEVRGADGTVTLLDRGTQVFGEIRSGLREGQDRLFILWVRARTPQNIVITLDSPAADELGRSGAPGYVNDHFWSRFGAALLYSLIDYGPELGVAALQNNRNGIGNNSNAYQYTQFVQPQQSLANTILKEKLDVPPVLEQNQGATLTIFVARDLDFSSVYDLRASE